VLPPPGGAPLGTPPPGKISKSPPASPAGPVSEKKSKPSIFFLIIDFLVFGGAVAATVFLFLKP
jgi:hypothetical protein